MSWTQNPSSCGTKDFFFSVVRLAKGTLAKELDDRLCSGFLSTRQADESADGHSLSAEKRIFGEYLHLSGCKAVKNIVK